MGSTRRPSRGGQLWLRVKRIGDNVIDAVTMVMLTVLAAIQFGQVFMRYVVKSPWYWTEEISRLLLIYLAFLGSSIALRYGQHASVDLITDKLPVYLRKHVAIIGLACVAVFSAATSYYAIRMAKSVWYVATPIGIPRGVPYLAMVIGGIWTVVEAITQVMQRLGIVTDQNPGASITGSEGPEYKEEL